MTTHAPSRTVAIVVPLSNRKDLTPDEKISLKHLQHFLGCYDKYLIVPKSLGVTIPGFDIKPFDPQFFGSARAHTELQLSQSLYESFKEYKFILMYHLDALVFSDRLMEWCQADWDYIGAPWLNCDDSPWVKLPRVGNSGFCLIKIESFLKVLRSTRRQIDPHRYWKEFYAHKPKYVQYLNLPKKYLKRLRVFNNVRREIARFPNSVNSDYFWSVRAINYYPEFKVAPVEAGLRFAFEVAPRRCFELNNYQLPFGCHAWTKFDREFWGPYLLK